MSWLGPANSVEKKMTENEPSVQKLELWAIFIISNQTKPVSMSQLNSADKWMGWNWLDWILFTGLVPLEHLAVLKVPSFISKGFDWLNWVVDWFDESFDFISASQAVSGGGMVSDWRPVISLLHRSDPQIGESRPLIGITGPNLIDPGTGVHQSGGTW